MATPHLDLLLHPVRMRMVNAMRAAGTLTTFELAARLPDLPKATVYRHVERLLRGGVLEVESARPVRGAVERRYRLARSGAGVSDEDARSMSLEDHRHAFTAATAALVADFHRYLDRPDADPVADLVSYRQFTVWLTPEERARLIADVVRALRAPSSHEPGKGRVPYLLSTIFFPANRSAPKRRKAPCARS